MLESSILKSGTDNVINKSVYLQYMVVQIIAPAKEVSDL